MRQKTACARFSQHERLLTAVQFADNHILQSFLIHTENIIPHLFSHDTLSLLQQGGRATAVRGQAHIHLAHACAITYLQPLSTLRLQNGRNTFLHGRFPDPHGFHRANEHGVFRRQFLGEQRRHITGIHGAQFARRARQQYQPATPGL